MEVSGHHDVPISLPRGNSHGVHWKGGWVEPIASVDGLEERKICRWRVQTPEHPDRSLVTTETMLHRLASWLGLLVFGATAPPWAMAASFTRFLDHTQRHITAGRTPVDEWSARPRDLYLTTHNTHNIPTSMHSVGFEPTTSASEWPQTYALERAATGIGKLLNLGRQHTKMFGKKAVKF